jgi:hypothetical protein
VLVAHLIDAEAGEGGVLACAAAVASSPAGVRQRVLVLGPAWVEARARALGLAVDARVSPGGVGGLSQGRSLRPVLKGAAPDCVQAWSLSAGRAADRAGFGSRLIVCGSTPAGPLEWLGSPTVAIWPWQDRERWRAAGAVDIRELPDPALGSPWNADRDAYRDVRAELGIEPEDEAVALLADPPADGDARRFVYLLGLLHVGGRRIIGLVPEGVSSLDRSARYTRAHGRRWGLIPVRGPMCRAVVAADVAALDDARPDQSGLLATVATGAGVPIVRIGPGPAAPEVARRSATWAMDALDRRHERFAARAEAGAAGGAAFVATLCEIWRDGAAALHAAPV